MIYTITATFTEAAYYHTMLFGVTGMRPAAPVDADAFSSGPGSRYSTLVTRTRPQSVCVEYANGGYDPAKMVLHHYCGVGQFQVGYSWQQSGAGSTTVSGTMTQTAATDWLHSAWEIAP